MKIILIKTMRLSKTKQLSGTEVVALRNGWVYLAREDSSFDGMDAVGLSKAIQQYCGKIRKNWSNGLKRMSERP